MSKLDELRALLGREYLGDECVTIDAALYAALPALLDVAEAAEELSRELPEHLDFMGEQLAVDRLRAALARLDAKGGE